MKKAIIARKIGMTQVFGEGGVLIPVTVLEAEPNVVAQVKTKANDGYSAVQLGFGAIKPKRLIKPREGHFKKAGIEPKRHLREFKLANAEEYSTGTEIKADIFSVGDRVDVVGRSKGKGFQGAIKRHGFGRGPMSHGSKYHRHQGSLSSGTTPGKVKKGKKMPGHMGDRRVTVQNLEIVRADAQKNILLIRGAVPGSRGSLLMVKESVKVK